MKLKQHATAHESFSKTLHAYLHKAIQHRREYRTFPDLLDILQLNTANLLKFIHNTLNIQCPAYVTVRYIHVHIILMNKLLQMK